MSLVDPYNCYTKEEFTRFIDVNKIKTIFEIGARECGYTQDIVDHYTSCVNLHCFECNPLTIDLCKQNVNKINKLQNKSLKQIKLNNLGISSVEEVVKFYPVLVGNDYGSSSAGFHPTEKSHSIINRDIEVKCTTIDIYCEQNSISSVDMILIDIEGGELKAFEGAKNILPTVSYIIAETQDVMRNKDTPLRSDIAEYLSQFGFVEKYTTCNGYFGDSLFVK